MQSFVLSHSGLFDEKVIKLRIEELLNAASDSESTGMFNDMLASTVSSVNSKYARKALDDDELQMVAGGQDPSVLETVLKMKKTICSKM